MIFEEIHISVLVPSIEVQKILSYSELPDGWDYGMGSAPSILTIERAIEIHDQFISFGFEIDSTPMTNGGITLTFNKGIYFVDVIINADNTFDIREEEGIGIDYCVTNQERNVSLDRIAETLNVTIEKWLSSETLISENTSQASEDFKVIASATSVTESLYSSGTVL